jgi:acetyltransferase EpsM
MVDDDPKLNYFNDIPIINSTFLPETAENIALIIAIGNNITRKKISSRFNEYNFLSSIHKTAFVSPSATVGIGTVIMLYAIINTDAKIGDHVIINTGALIEHDCIIEDFVHISPKVTLSGNVKIGTGSHIGSGAIVIPGIKIGKWCTIGAGTIIINDIPDGATVIGNPGKIIKYNTTFETQTNIENSNNQKKTTKINSKYLNVNSFED